MTVRVPNKKKTGFEAWVVDFREKAPAGASTDMFAGRPNAARVGGLSAGVPGSYIHSVRFYRFPHILPIQVNWLVFSRHTNDGASFLGRHWLHLLVIWHWDSRLAESWVVVYHGLLSCS
jgi:hypothetical protein